MQRDFSGCQQDVKINGKVIYKGRECQDRLKIILKHISPGDSILDIGSHTGYFAIELARRGHRVRSYEENRHLADIQKWVAKENNVELSIYDKPYSINNYHFDVVLLLNVLQYFSMEIFLKQIAEVGKKIIIEWPTPEETECLYIDKIKETFPFRKYLLGFFTKVELIGETEAPYMKGVKRNLWLCEK